MPFAALLPRVFELLAPAPGTIRPREPPPSLHLHYRNYCAIISRALISSPQGGYMVHAARASFTLRACLWQGRRAHPHATTPSSSHRSKISHPQLVSVLPAISNRHNLQLESSVTSRKQTTAPNSNQHKFCPNSAPALRAPAVTTHQSPITPFLFDTNKTHRIIIPPRPLLKTKEKQFSIRYKFAVGSIGNLACAPRFCIGALRNQSNQTKPNKPNRTRHGRIAYATGATVAEQRVTIHKSRITTHRLLGSAGGANLPGGVGPNWLVGAE